MTGRPKSEDWGSPISGGPLAARAAESSREPSRRRIADCTKRHAEERFMGRNVTIGLGTLIIIIILVALLF